MAALLFCGKLFTLYCCVRVARKQGNSRHEFDLIPHLRCPPSCILASTFPQNACFILNRPCVSHPSPSNLDLPQLNTRVWREAMLSTFTIVASALTLIFIIPPIIAIFIPIVPVFARLLGTRDSVGLKGNLMCGLLSF